MGYIEEQNIIGSLLMDNNSISEIYSMISPEMFESELFGRMYLEFLRGYDNRYEVTIAVLVQKIKDTSFPESIIQDTLKTCIANTVTSANNQESCRSPSEGLQNQKSKDHAAEVCSAGREYQYADRRNDP